MRIIKFCILFLLVYSQCKSQNADPIYIQGDSIYFKIRKIDSLRNYNIYQVYTFNASSKPYGILHASNIWFFQDPTATLAPISQTETIQFYSLNYSARDTSYDDLPEDWSLNSQIVLPFQSLTFSLNILRSNKEQRLKIKYIKLLDLCYNDFIEKIYANSSMWHKTYKKNEILLIVPNKWAAYNIALASWRQDEPTLIDANSNELQ